jgi:hypothetical protein
MASQSHHLAVFLAGIAFQESLGHWWLGIWGRDILPIKLGPWSFTYETNLLFMIGWPIVLGSLVWYVWIRRQRQPAL